MRASFFVSLLAAVPLAYAQNAILDALNGAGLTSLAGLVGAVASTTEGQAFLQQVQAGPRTLFAPDNAAISSITLPTNTTAAISILSYHLVSGSFPNPYYFTVAPRHTVLRTFLTDPAFTQLEGGFPQVLVTESGDGSNVFILRQDTNVTVSATNTVGNLVVHTINAVLIPPTADTLATAATRYNFNQLLAFANGTQAAGSITSSRGFTVFAPNNAAITALMASPAAASLTAQQIEIVLGNHIIAGSTVYSPQMQYESRVSASGQPFTFATNSSGVFVTSGATTAKVVLADVLLPNGVVHVIDRVLANTESNPALASSVYAGATQYAGSNPTETGAVGGGITRQPGTGMAVSTAIATTSVAIVTTSTAMITISTAVLTTSATVVTSIGAKARFL